MLRKRRLGFSLIEILVAIAITAAATAVVLRSAGGLREQSYKVVARDNVRKVQEAFDQWLSDQPSVEYARSQFNPSAYSDHGATSIQTCYPANSVIKTHLAGYLDQTFLDDFQMTGGGGQLGRYKTRALEEAGGYMTIFWNADYRSENIKALITLP